MTDAAVAEPDEPQPAPPQPAAYAAVVYFHGMGSQRRYEESSRLIDSLDRYLAVEHRAGRSQGMLRNIKARVEPLRAAPASNDIVGYIRTVFSTGPQAENARTVRFYEAYWAPVMAGNASAWGVVKWLLGQPLRPWRTLRAPWRERQRMRRASLVALAERRGIRPGSDDERDYNRLMQLYDRFEGLGAQRDHPEGTFDDFLAFLARQNDGRPQAAQRLAALARAWFTAYRWSELRNAAALAIMALTLFLIVGALLGGIVVALQSLLAFAPLAELLASFGEPPKADWKTAVAIGTALAALFGVTRFL
ncbi:MAG: hypothetical protein FJX11_15740 [Alphaproteobacteria bacterium]|nr:hypothetical protein [Alphaproteobacteria bacterium]